MTIRTSSYERSQEPITVQRTTEHQMVHEGKTFYLNIDYGAIGAATNNVLIRTGNNAVHLRRVASFNESGNHFIRVYEDPAVTSLGNAQTAVCANRIIAERTSPQTLVYRDSVASTIGNLISTVYDFGKTGTGSQGDDAVPELILDRNSNYFIQSSHFTPAGNVAMILAWYEFAH